MKIFFLSLAFILAFIGSYGQINKIDRQGLNFYQSGSNYLKSGEYNLADSLLSLALCTYKNENVYFNRGLSRLYKSDTLGFCSDMNIASNFYLDKEAEKLFCQYCCKKVDTSYYKSGMRPSSKQSFRYYEVYQVNKYDSIRMGKFHDQKSKHSLLSFDFGCDNSLLTVCNKKSDIVGIYFVIDTLKVFYFTSQPSSISDFYENKYKIFKNDLSALLRTKFQEWKKTNNIDKITVYYRIIISKTGDVISVEVTGTEPEVNFEANIKECEQIIFSHMKFCPKYEPAIFFNKKVNSSVNDSVIF